MDWDVVAIAVVGLGVCCFGFFRRPRGTLELISARFVIPLMVAMATFVQVIWHFFQDVNVDIYQQCRVIVGFDAVLFITACMLCFWIGYALPFGKWGTRLLSPLAIPVNPGRSILTAAYTLCCFAVLIFIADLVAGDIMMSLPGIQPFTIVVIFVAAVLLGLSFPEKSQRGAFDLPLLLFWLLILSAPLMATFSRGVGIPVVAAAAAYSVRRGKLNWIGIGAALMWAVICAQIAFFGRGTVGHYAGILAWVQVIFSGSFWENWQGAFSSAMFGNDSFTPLCVSMRAVVTTNVFALTPLNWFIFQIPLPHVFSWSPAYTLDLPQYLGGSGSWNYTPGMFGDLYIHLGWAGCAMFVVVGCVYRAADELAFSPCPEGTFSPFFLLAVFGYVAMALGLFNNFRSWNTAFFDGLCFVVFLLFLRKVLVPADVNRMQDERMNHLSSTAQYGTDW